MNPSILHRCVRRGSALLLGFGCAASAVYAQRTALAVRVASVPATAIDGGALPGSASLNVTLYLKPTAERTTALKQYLADVQTSSDPAYHVWLTPSQFGRRFGATDAQIAAVKSWAGANSFTVSAVADSGLAISLTGTVAQVENALAPSLHAVQVGAKTYVANTAVPAIDDAVAGNVLTVGGLSTLPSTHPTTVATVSGAATLDDPLAALTAAVDANSEGLLSLSSTSCVEDVDAASQAAMQLRLQQASAQGITVLTASGCGARGSAGFPATLEEVTAAAIAPGIVTPSTATLTEARPAWQKASGLPDDAFRHEPDFTVSDLSALAKTLASILASIPVKDGDAPARLGNINTTLYELATIKGLYTQPDSATAGTWEAATGLGLVDLQKLAEFFPRAALSDYVSIDYSPYAITHGATVTFKSNVKDISGQGGGVVPTGTVTFKLSSGLTLGPVPLDGSGNAQTGSNQLPAGTYSLSATYSGDSVYAANTSMSENVVVNQEQMTLTASQVATVQLGGNIALIVTAKSSSGVGTPTGKVTVQGAIDRNIYYGTLSGSGGTATATVTFPAVQAGSLTVVVTCDGSDPNFTCPQQQVNVNVSLATPTVKLAFSPTAPASGQSESFIATITGAGNGSPTPTGTIEFQNNGVTFDSRTLSGNTASVSTVNFNYAASNNFTAKYDGDNNYNSTSSASAPAGLIATATTVAANPLLVTIGGTATLYATVTPVSTGSAPVSGTVQFGSLCTATVVAGSGNCTATFSSAGVYPISATYSGDSVYAGSSYTSAAVNVQARKGDTTVALTTNPSPPVSGQSTTLVATISAANGASSTNAFSGQVMFFVNGAVAGTATVAGGQASVSVTLASGTSMAYAVYNGDNSWTGNTSPTVSLTPGSTGSGGSTTTGVTLTTSTDFAVAGTNIILTASVKPTATGTATVSGTVTFYDLFNGQTTALGTVGVTSAGPGLGVAQFSSTGLLSGKHVVTATYSGNSSYGAATSDPHTIFLSDYTLSFAPASITVPQGGTSSTTVTVTPLVSFGGTVALACIPPANSFITCSFSPATVAAGGASTLTVTTQTPKLAENHPLLLVPSVGSSVAMAALLFGFLLPGAKRRKPLLLFVLLSVCLFGSLGCTHLINAGGGTLTTGTAKGTYSLTISSAGTDRGTTVTHSTQVQVLVQ